MWLTGLPAPPMGMTSLTIALMRWASGRRHLRRRGRRPAQRVARVVELAGQGGELERAERVAHDRQLVRRPGAEGLLHRAGLGAVRQPARVQREAADVDALARGVVAVDVVHDLLGLEVRV